MQNTEEIVAVRAQNLSRELSGTNAVNDVSFEIQFGKVYGLLGPNGAGKTTTLRMLACLLQPSAGSLEICGMDVVKNTQLVKRDVGFLTSGMKLYESFTPEECFNIFGRLRSMDAVTIKDRVDQLVTELELQDFFRKRIGKLSTGQHQRVTIANTLLHNPRVLILDEITLSLDIISTAFVLNIVKKERDRGRCIIFSTHSMSEAEYLCDEIGFIYKGTLVKQGSPKDIISSQKTSNLTDAFLSVMNSEKAKES